MFSENIPIKKRFRPAAALEKKVTAILSKYCKQTGILTILMEDTFYIGFLVNKLTKILVYGTFQIYLILLLKNPILWIIHFF